MAIPLASAFVRVRPDVDQGEFKKEGRRAGETAGREYADGFSRDAGGGLRKANSQFATDAEKSAHEGGGRSGRAFGKNFGNELGGKGSVFATVAKVFASRFALVGGAAAAATPSLLNLTAALLPAAGALVELPAAGLAFAAALNTVKLATSGVGDAIKKGFTGTAKQAEKALSALPPAARSFAKSIIELKPQIESLKASVSAQFFRPLSDEVRPLATVLFPLLRREMSALAGPLGGIAEQFAQTARRSEVLNAITATFRNTRLSVVDLRASIQPLVLAFAALIQSTAGQLPRLAQGFTDLSKRVAAFVTQAAQSGRITEVYRASIVTLRDLGGVVLNVGSIFVSVFRAATSNAGGLLSNLRELTGQAAAFLRSAQGMGALRDIFGVLAAVSAAMRTALAGVLPQVAQSFKILGPAIAAAVTPMGQLLAAVAPLLPVLSGIAATVLRALTPAIAGLATFLSQNAGLVKAATVAWVAFLSVQRASAAILAVQAAGGLLGYLKTIKLVTIATKIWAAAQVILDVALNANPIGIVITAIAALVAGIVIAYKNSQTFRNIVQAVWAAIKVAIGATVNWITGVVVPGIKRAWDGIAAGAMWLYHNVITPVWNGIRVVIQAVIKAVSFYVTAWTAILRVVATVVTWLYRTIFQPVFGAIRKVVEVWWLATQIIFKAFTNVLRTVVGGAIQGWKIVFTAAFNFIKNNVVIPWWNVVRGIFALFRQYVLGPIVSTLNTVRLGFTTVFNAVRNLIVTWWRSYVSPTLTAVRTAWNNLATGFSIIYNSRIKPVFTAFINFIKGTVVGGFRSGVALITAAWDKVREAARKPVAFVVNRVINPFINGLNAAAAVVGVKDRVSTIKGFVAGGEIPAYASGGRITGPPSNADNRLAPARVPGMGAVKLAGGEFIVNAKDTARALPLLKWINSGMKMGAQNAGRMLGKPLTREPGDGSEGWAFKDGGLVGWVKDVWGAITNPIATIKKPFEALLRQVPGSGLIRNFLLGGANKLLNGAVSWLGRLGGGGGNVGKAQAFVKAQAGKPYVWNSAGPGGYDCSGIVSAVYNVFKGKKPYNHTFSTGSMPGKWFAPGLAGSPMVAGWSHPGQRPASASVGHTAGRIGGLPFESTGSAGVRVGGSARTISQFANIGHARAAGGLVGPPVRVFDKGGFWPSGTLGANLSGRTEYVDPARHGVGGGDVHFHFHNSVITSERQAEDLVVAGFNSAKRHRRIQ
jgi:phage-related protein